MKITKTLLRRHDACEYQVELFAATFPRGTGVTRRSLAKAREAGLDVGWLTRFMSPAARAAYEEALAAAWAAYKEALAAAWAAYEEALAAAWAAYKEATAPAYAAYKEAIAPAWAAYEEALAAAYAAYKEAMDEALVAAFAEEG